MPALNGSISFDETSSAEQLLLTLPISGQTKITSMFIDFAASTKATIAIVYSKINGTDFREVMRYSGEVITDTINLFGWGAVDFSRETEVRLVCDGSGAESKTIYYNLNYSTIDQGVIFPRVTSNVDITADGAYNYYDTDFDAQGYLAITAASTGNVVIKLYRCSGRIAISSVKTTGNVDITMYDCKGLLKTNLADSGNIIVECFSCQGAIENQGTIDSLFLNTSPMSISGNAISSIVKNGRFDAAIAAGDIAIDAITAAAVKADAVTKIQNGLATPTNITAGTITTVTNLTNAPTAGDLTATMKASIAVAVWDELLSVARVAGSFGAKIKAWVLGTDNKSLISTDAQDLSATLDVNAKKLNGDVPPTGGASQEYLETVKADTVLLKQKIGITV